MYLMFRPKIIVLHVSGLASTIMSASSVCLRNGVRMPAVGFGTYQIKDPSQLRSAVLCALSAGYRHIDTAAVYKVGLFLVAG